MDVLDVSRARAVPQRDQQGLQRACFPLGYHLDIAAAQVPTEPDQAQIAGTVHHEVAEPHPLNTALNNRVNTPLTSTFSHWSLLTLDFQLIGYFHRQTGPGRLVAGERHRERLDSVRIRRAYTRRIA
jgi:hypothetical protein